MRVRVANQNYRITRFGKSTQYDRKASFMALIRCMCGTPNQVPAGTSVVCSHCESLVGVSRHNTRLTPWVQIWRHSGTNNLVERPAIIKVEEHTA